jgi:signal-transduction protein with cAMP-binding, CBS, and nucleotidyltransferase domain
VRTLAPTDTLVAAAQAMDEWNVGAIPVCDGDRLVGMITDRDITVRGVAQGRPLDGTPLADVMTEHVRWCYEDDPVDEQLAEMRAVQIRRLPVVDREQHLVGMLSLGDIAVKADPVEAGEALVAISLPAEPDRSSAPAAPAEALPDSAPPTALRAARGGSPKTRSKRQKEATQ